jgi:hypothetical protein
MRTQVKRELGRWVGEALSIFAPLIVAISPELAFRLSQRFQAIAESDFDRQLGIARRVADVYAQLGMDVRFIELRSSPEQCSDCKSQTYIWFRNEGRCAECERDRLVKMLEQANRDIQSSTRQGS